MYIILLARQIAIDSGGSRRNLSYFMLCLMHYPNRKMKQPNERTNTQTQKEKKWP